MGFQTSASRTDLLLQCGRPFDPALEVEREEPTEPMRNGSCVHELQDTTLTRGAPSGHTLAEVCKKWGVEDVEGAGRHCARGVMALRSWMIDNPFGLEFRVLLSEVPHATNVVAPKTRTRVCGFEASTHTYDLRAGEVAGTFDVLLESLDGSTMCVVDLKTGDYGDWTSPGKLGQLRTLVAQCRAKWPRVKRWLAAILHSQRDGVPIVYCDEVEAEESRAHLLLLRKAMGRVGDGSLRPGFECARCPAREGCPANDGALLARSGAMVKMSTVELMREAVEPGQLHMFLTQFEALAKRAREALREEVRRGVVVIRPDGKVLELSESEVENLSKKSIIEALGKEEGEKVIEELRQRNCVPKSKRETLRAVGDK